MCEITSIKAIALCKAIGGGGGGGGSVESKAVNLYADGERVASYSAEEFAALSALPANPPRDGLTAQGWNWSLSDAKAYVAAYGALNVGQTYITTDGKTHIHIHLEQGRTSPMLSVCPAGTVDVDWGDGSTHDTLTGTSTSTVKWTPTHNYAAPGDYVIKLTVSEGGSMGFYGSSLSDEFSGLLRFSSSGDTRNKAYHNAIHAVFVGSGVTRISDSAFQNCTSLSNITIPSSVTSIGDSAFRNCTSLSNITIPSSTTSIDSSAFQNCYSLSNITIPSSVTSISNGAFNNCTSLSNITIPSNATIIGGSAFNNCTSLSNITIPSSATSIGNNALNACGSLSELHFLPTSPPLVTNSNTFSGIPTDCKIYVPTGRLSAYTSENNYPSSSTYTYIEE